MITKEQLVAIRHLHFGEHFPVGTIADQLAIHHTTVRLALDLENRPGRRSFRTTLTDPFVPFIRQTLERYPSLRSTRLYQMICPRGYQGSVVQLRRAVKPLRPVSREAFLHRVTYPGEESQVDWASFGTVRVGRAERKLSCFVLTLSYSRGLYPEFSFDQRLDSFLRGHAHAYDDLGGAARTSLLDNLRSAVLDRQGDVVRFNPAYLDLCAHYHVSPRPCNVGRGNEKGRVERAIQYIRHSFFAGRPFTTLADLNRQALEWRDQVAHQRPWPGDDSKTVQQALDEERTHLLALPVHPYQAKETHTVLCSKTLLVRFDLNDYSVPPEALGKPLGLSADSDTVTLALGAEVIATHRRSYDRHLPIEEPSHRKALLAQKALLLSASSARRVLSIPDADAYLEAALSAGHARASVLHRLTLLSSQYGVTELSAALREAVERSTPHDSSLLVILERRRRTSKKRAPLPVSLSHRPDLEILSVTPHALDTYDHLAKKADDDDDAE